MKKFLALIMAAMLMCPAAAVAGAEESFDVPGGYSTEMADIDFGTYGQAAWEYLQLIDSTYPDRDCIAGEDTEAFTAWLIGELKAAGYTDDMIVKQEFTFNPDWDDSDEEYTSYNIVVTLPGAGDKQILVGGHYDGTGTGDNGSGVAVMLETACKLVKEEPLEETIVFIFYSAEEYGLYGSGFYASSMTEDEIANTLYLVNLDSVLCGDYCYVYGGVPDYENQTVESTEAFDKAWAIGKEYGLMLHMNPWTYENPAPGYDAPDYPSPSTGFWSDHVHFSELGIPYVYFEATNWDIPGPYEEYDGYGETADFGMLMNTENDYLSFIEHLFPGRSEYHLKVFSLLLDKMLTE